MSISGSIIKKLNESNKFAKDLSQRHGPRLMELADTDDNEGFVKYFENNISDIVNSFDEIVNFLKNNNCYSGLDLLYDCMHDYDDYIKSHHLKESIYGDEEIPDDIAKKFKDDSPEWLGLPNTIYRYHGGWSDPEVEYNGKLYNEWDVQEYIGEVMNRANC